MIIKKFNFSKVEYFITSYSILHLFSKGIKLMSKKDNNFFQSLFNETIFCLNI